MGNINNLIMKILKGDNNNKIIIIKLDMHDTGIELLFIYFLFIYL